MICFSGRPQHLVVPRIQAQPLGGIVEARHHRLERILLVEEAVLVGADQGLGGTGSGAHRGSGVLHGELQAFHGGHDGVQRGGDSVTAVLPHQVEHRHQRLGSAMRASGRGA